MRNGLGMSVWEMEKLNVLKKQAGIEKKEGKKKRKNRSGNANPLSCLKKKKKAQPTEPSKTSTKSGKIRKRKIKIAPHIKEALMTEIRNKCEV